MLSDVPFEREPSMRDGCLQYDEELCRVANDDARCNKTSGMQVSPQEVRECKSERVLTRVPSSSSFPSATHPSPAIPPTRHFICSRTTYHLLHSLIHLPPPTIPEEVLTCVPSSPAQEGSPMSTQ